ncbi:hypothetical protein O988_05135 [Pseudogymnoascus sp. VKM F-3808]|nr:hypothetical protein O988_05135 [Pseudogymnoascus sp. VKM F-3808]
MNICRRLPEEHSRSFRSLKLKYRQNFNEANVATAEPKIILPVTLRIRQMLLRQLLGDVRQTTDAAKRKGEYRGDFISEIPTVTLWKEPPLRNATKPVTTVSYSIADNTIGVDATQQTLPTCLAFKAEVTSASWSSAPLCLFTPHSGYNSININPISECVHDHQYLCNRCGIGLVD